MTKKLLSLALTLAILFSFASCMMKSGFDGADKTFTCEGMSITLTDGFVESAYEGMTVCYDSLDAAVFCLKEPFTLIEGMESYTVEQYAALVIEANAANTPTLTTEDGIPVMEYSFRNETMGETYSYFAAMYKTDDSFWSIQFACDKEIYAEKRDTFVKWAKSVSFAEPSGS